METKKIFSAKELQLLYTLGLIKSSTSTRFSPASHKITGTKGVSNKPHKAYLQQVTQYYNNHQQPPGELIPLLRFFEKTLTGPDSRQEGDAYS